MIYLATSLFDAGSREHAERLARAISTLGHRVYYPWRDAGDQFYSRLHGEGTNEWCAAVFSENIAALRRCSFVVAILDGADVDSGVAWEVGFVHALGKRVIGLRSDFRVHAKPDLCVNLMLANSCETILPNVDTLLRLLDDVPRARVVTASNVTAFYNAVAREYDDAILHPHTAALRQSAMAVAKALCSQSPVDCELDIGGGTSTITATLPARIKFVVEPAVQMIMARNDPEDVVCVSTAIENLVLPERMIDRAVCLLALDHMESPSEMLKRLRPSLRMGAEVILVYQSPEEEMALRRDPDYFEFNSVTLNTVFRVPSYITRLKRFGEHIPAGYRVESQKKEASTRVGVAPTVGIRCTRIA
jgi:nucleoside 2-deoxyribosyltransferase